MNISEIKTKLGVETLDLNYLKDDKGERSIDPTTKEPTKWKRHWDNENRIAVIIHDDVDRKSDNLALKWETKTPAGKESYQMAIIIGYTAPDEKL